MIRILCEWDVGQDGLIFETKEAARAWIDNNGNIADVLEEGDINSVESLFEYGLLSYETLKIIK